MNRTVEGKLNKEELKQNKYKETWIADLGILFYPISWRSSGEKEKEEDRLHVSKEKLHKELLAVQTVSESAMPKC